MLNPGYSSRKIRFKLKKTKKILINKKNALILVNQIQKFKGSTLTI